MSAQDQTTANQGTAADETLRAGDLLETARQMPDLSRFVEALQQAGLETELRSVTMRTVFAPVNSAFEGAEAGQDLIARHIVRGRQIEADLRTTDAVQSIRGDAVPVEFHSEGSRFGGAKIIRRDIACSNGILHVIDRTAS